MAQSARKMAHTGGTGLFIIGTVLYLAFVILFLWQTAEFVDWLFPADQVIYRVITVATFDVMALLWAAIDTFYRFATRASHNLVKWAWTISFIAALVASVFYMVLQSFTRLNFQPDITWVDVGFGIVILVTVLQILFLTFFIRLEWMARHPMAQDYEYDQPAMIVEADPAPRKSIDTEPRQSAAPKRIDAPRKSIDTEPHRRTVKQLPPKRRFTRTEPKMPTTKIQEEKEVGTATDPLAARVAVKRNQGPYKVNRSRSVPALPTND